MANKTRLGFSLKQVEETAGSLIQRDRLTQDRLQQDQDERRFLPLERVLDRAENTRSINAAHVAALMESIKTLGLLEPIVVDQHGRLLAGAHRLMAVRQLKTLASDDYGKHFSSGVPVRQMPFDSETESDRALEVEVAENEFRRDYTREEIQQLIHRLRTLGYRETVGRPKEGEKALGPAVQVIIHKSLRSVRRLIAEADGVNKTPRGESSRAKRARVQLQKLTDAKVTLKERTHRVTVVFDFPDLDEVESFLGRLASK